MSLVREIEKKYEAKFGKIQPCCRLYKNYCRCGKETRAKAQRLTTE